MNIHPVAQLFPMLPEKELRELAESIKTEGLLNPCVVQNGLLLDGRNRIAACKIAGVEPNFIEYKGNSPVAFIIGANLARRHLSKEQTYALYIEIEPHFAEEAKKRRGGDRRSEEYQSGKSPTLVEQAKSRDQAAAAVGISGKTGSKLKKIKKEAPDIFQNIIEKKTTLPKAIKELKTRNDKESLSAAQKTIDAEKKKNIESVCDIRMCSCADIFRSGIRPDAVITDPPYPAEFLHVFSELAEGCKIAGVPLVAVMSGQSYLPEVMQRMCEHLKYRWMLAYMTPGGQAVQQWSAKVNTSWKPVLLFGEAVEWFGDVAVSKPNDNDKRFHGWGQSESGMYDLVQRLTKPGQLICDPFLGGGTTAVVSLALSRRFVGCDIDASNVELSRSRVMV